MEFRTLAEGLQFPEGPVALVDGSVVLVEIAAGALTRIAADGDEDACRTAWRRPQRRGGGSRRQMSTIANNGGFEWHREGGHIRPLTQARDYAGGRIERVDLATGAAEVLYRDCGEVPLKGPNDLVFDAHGGFYFTDLGKRRPRDMDVGAVYYAKADGSFITEVAYPMITPNGIGLSPDGNTLYVAETEAARLWAFPIEAPEMVRKEPWLSPHGGRIVAGMGGYQRFELAGGAGRRPDLRRHAGQRRHHGDLAGRAACRAPRGCPTR